MRDLRNLRYKGASNKKNRPSRISIAALIIIIAAGAGLMIFMPKVKKGQLSQELIPGQIVTKAPLHGNEKVLSETDDTEKQDSFTFYNVLSNKEGDIVPLNEDSSKSKGDEEVQIKLLQEEEIQKADIDMAKHAEKKREESDIYSVQVAALSKEAKANEVLTILKGKGYAPYMIKEENRIGGGLFKIRVGRFHSIVDAEEVAQVLKQDGYDTYVIKADTPHPSK